MTPYPHWLFPPIASSVICEIVSGVKAPEAMVGNSVLAAMALAIQAQYRVKRREGLESPCSLALVSICGSGERKTTVDKLTSKAFREFEVEQLHIFEKEHAKYRSAQLIWKTHLGVLMRRLQKAIQSGEPLAEFEAAIINHEDALPKPPKRIRYLYNDTTSAALLQGLHENTRSVCLNEDEAARFFDGPLSADASLINKGWDGSDLTVDRRTSECFSVKSPRISLNLMVQPSAFAKYMAKKGEEARGVGFIARWLVCYPTTTQGTRFEYNSQALQNSQQEKFNERIKELLLNQVENGFVENPSSEIVLNFTREAEHEWILIANQIENAIQPGGYFFQASDYASKIAENIARIAGVFHVFSGDMGTEISLKTLQSAASLAQWYAAEFIRLFSPPTPLQELLNDAIVVEQWLIEFVQKKGMFWLDKTILQQYGPNPLRKKLNRLNLALNYLIHAQRLRIDNVGKRKKIVVLNENFFGAIARGDHPIGFVPLS